MRNKQSNGMYSAMRLVCGRLQSVIMSFSGIEHRNVAKTDHIIVTSKITLKRFVQSVYEMVNK